MESLKEIFKRELELESFGEIKSFSPTVKALAIPPSHMSPTR